MNTIKKKEAIEKGLTHYFTGKLCHNGHMSKRFVSTGACIDCNRLNQGYHGRGQKGKVLSEEAKANISAGMMGNQNSGSEANKLALSKRMKGNQYGLGKAYCLGKVASTETKIKMSNSHKGKKLTERAKELVSDTHHGSQNGMAKLNEQLVWDIRFGKWKYLSVLEVSIKLCKLNYKIHDFTINKIRTHPDTYWKRVTEDLYENV